jgi:hypothetical protein
MVVYGESNYNFEMVILLFILNNFDSVANTFAINKIKKYDLISLP